MDPVTFVDQLIAETNEGYANSGIPLRAKLHCIIDSEVGCNFQQFIVRYKNRDIFTRKRDQYQSSTSLGDNPIQFGCCLP